MKRRNFTVSVAKKLLRMLEGDAFPSSSLPRWIVDELREEGLMTAVTHGSWNSFRLTDVEACDRYIRDNYTSGNSLAQWIEAMSEPDENLERSRLVQETGDSKSVRLRTFKGFLVNSYEPIEAMMGDSTFVISPVDGTAVFVQSPEIFRIPSDVVVVGVENGENFRLVRRQRSLFSSRKILFVSRYPQSSDLRNWLMKISNEYVHFGDYDLAGIHIYQSEFYRYLGEKAGFLIPEDIEERLKNGNGELYDIQYLKYRNLKIVDPRLNELVKMIHHYRKVYEQEGYIVGL